MSGILLQIQSQATDSLLRIADSLNHLANTPPAQQSISLFDLLKKGGVLMIPLGILSLIAIFFFIERYVVIRKAGRIESNFMNMIRDHIMNGNVTAARTLAKNTDNPAARMIEKGIQRIGKPIDNIERSMENVGKLEIYKLEKNMIILSMVAAVAPMFGFLGTIAGMIQTFFNISVTSDITLGTIAGGIYVKMITSATGLIIGIFAYMGYSYLNAQIDKVINKMEAAAAEFIDILQEPTR
ncbi:outer membrane transport energization protein ExbB [Thermoflavifilum aggregans]|uniref:Outer membrane transport energization protein ExbB n=1 Tax=Thermoflavifilum aggregans TaxID=454188 RepID=A0A2M9CWV2_9BACT|nr:MotA/TolQ/ExbB proton channel family protein [Thermoflavifilum aggregans]MBX6381320.1 MotA/TolQ/ExbB proton channel family protein [Thermoflavifilum aggregans]PJJ76373.1 outer membrane transport energization protein ExbB [Thermoflavifilum aggregans]